MAGLFSNYLVNWKINQFLTVFKMFILFLGFCTAFLAAPTWIASIVVAETSLLPVVAVAAVST